MSINRKASAIVEKAAWFIEYDQAQTWGLIGSATEEQEAEGIDYPNVQSALDDLYEYSMLPPGSIYQSLSSKSPGVEPTTTESQNVTITVSGTASAAGTVVIDGFSVAIESGDTSSAIATKIAEVLSADTVAISSAVASGSTVTYEYQDSNTHETINTTLNGVTFTSKTNTIGGEVGYLGYGSWELLGSETKYTRMIYTWLRVA